jgi:hypothetical protein
MIRALEKTDLVVVDCRAASTEVFFNYFDEIDLRLTLKDLSAALTLVMPINQEADSIDQLNRATEKLKNPVPTSCCETPFTATISPFLTTPSSASGC